jgi:hypothetical protein
VIGWERIGVNADIRLQCRNKAKVIGTTLKYQEDAIEAIERGSTTAPVAESLKDALAKQGEK